MKFRITITLTKIFAFLVAIFGFLLSAKTGDIQAFVTGVTAGLAILGIRKGANSIVDFKAGKIQPRAE